MCISLTHGEYDNELCKNPSGIYLVFTNKCPRCFNKGDAKPMENTLTPDDVCTWMIPLRKPDLSGSGAIDSCCRIDTTYVRVSSRAT